MPIRKAAIVAAIMIADMRAALARARLLLRTIASSLTAVMSLVAACRSARVGLSASK